jgi:DNA helicase-2/ATP-dependent DNA helicase PcrA
LHTFRRTLYGESEIREPSRFLRDIPVSLIHRRKEERHVRQESLGLGPGRYLGRQRSGFTAFSPEKGQLLSSAEPASLHFQTGDEVRHQVFGQGIVIESKPLGGDEQVTVAFAGVGLKRLMASMAPMEKLESTG